jgi:hypothetical protein
LPFYVGDPPLITFLLLSFINEMVAYSIGRLELLSKILADILTLPFFVWLIGENIECLQMKMNTL